MPGPAGGGGIHSTILEDEDFIRKLEAAIRALRKEGPPRFSTKRVLAMISLIAGAVVSLGGVVTWGINAYTNYGWVTRHEFTEAMTADGTLYETRSDYLQEKALHDIRNDRQDAEIKAAQERSNEILAYVKVVPQLKTLIRIRCMGNRDVQGTIEDLKRQYQDLTKTPYVEPQCDDPEIRVIRP